jgi:hypothetical protein
MELSGRRLLGDGGSWSSVALCVVVSSEHVRIKIQAMERDGPKVETHAPPTDTLLRHDYRRQQLASYYEAFPYNSYRKALLEEKANS